MWRKNAKIREYIEKPVRPAARWLSLLSLINPIPLSSARSGRIVRFHFVVMHAPTTFWFIPLWDSAFPWCVANKTQQYRRKPANSALFVETLWNFENNKHGLCYIHMLFLALTYDWMKFWLKKYQHFDDQVFQLFKLKENHSIQIQIYSRFLLPHSAFVKKTIQGLWMAFVESMSWKWFEPMQACLFFRLHLHRKLILRGTRGLLEIPSQRFDTTGAARV